MGKKGRKRQQNRQKTSVENFRMETFGEVLAPQVCGFAELANGKFCINAGDGRDLLGE